MARRKAAEGLDPVWEEYIAHKPIGEPIGEAFLHSLFVTNQEETDNDILIRFIDRVLMRDHVVDDGVVWFPFGRTWTFCRMERDARYLRCYFKKFKKKKINHRKG